MSTIEELLDDGILIEYEVPDYDTRERVRPAYYAPPFKKWFLTENRLQLPGRKGGKITGQEEIEEKLNDLRCDNPMHITDFARIKPQNEEVWEAKTDTTRLFGWFCKPMVFVVVSGAIKSDLVRNKPAVTAQLKAVTAFIKRHGLHKEVVRGGHLNVLGTKS